MEFCYGKVYMAVPGGAMSRSHRKWYIHTQRDPGGLRSRGNSRSYRDLSSSSCLLLSVPTFLDPPHHVVINRDPLVLDDPTPNPHAVGASKPVGIYPAWISLTELYILYRASVPIGKALCERELLLAHSHSPVSRLRTPMQVLPTHIHANTFMGQRE
jgi:hypothetical protein